MNLKLLGAAVIVIGSGSFGYRTSALYRRQEQELRNLLSALEVVQAELNFRLSPLPELCRMAAQGGQGAVKQLFLSLAAELECQISPDAGCCMDAVLARVALPPTVAQLAKSLGITLGRFDLDGQLRGIESVCQQAQSELKRLEHNRDFRLRSYQTLGLCAGAALAILLL